MRWCSRFVEQILRRLTFFFSRTYWVWVASVGGALVATAFILKSWEPWSAIFAGVGCSVLATVIVSLAGPAGDPLYQKFLELGVIKFYPGRQAVPTRDWVDWLRNTKYHCVVLGESNGGWFTDDD